MIKLKFIYKIIIAALIFAAALTINGCNSDVQENKEIEQRTEQSAEQSDDSAYSKALKNGDYTCEVTLSGGTGRATIESPTKLTVSDNGICAQIKWSSPNYDYMKVDGTMYMPVNTEGNSVFVIPVRAFDEPVSVIADTVAMSEPHEIEYTIIFSSKGITDNAQ